MFTPYLAPARLQTCITSAEALVLEDGCILRSSFSGVQSTCIPPTVVKAVGYYSYAPGISYPDPRLRLVAVLKSASVFRGVLEFRPIAGHSSEGLVGLRIG